VKSVLVISERDNVATALDALEPGRRIEVQGRAVTVLDAIPRGHKIALAPIGRGSAVIKYGDSIGLATADIRAGGHVHTHNVSSSRGRGDLGNPTASESSSRLAEPPDDRAEPKERAS
jgi:SAF domain